ncbi:MAG: sensor histidine kinase [Steroidobacteraceae bacterium]
MRNSGIWPLLLLTIFVVAALPLAAAFYFVDRALQTSLDLGFNESILRALQASADNLKTLRRLDPPQQDRYREQFESVERLSRIYSSPELLKAGILDSLKIYFGLGFLAVVLLSVLLAALLSRRITRSYNATFEELIRHQEKVRYLEEMASWQELAKMLAHEIKNPLTPIEVLVTSLSRAYLTRPEHEFREQLRQTQTMIGEELNHLKNTVSKFSEFATLPAVHLLAEDVPQLVAKLLQAIAVGFDTADIEIGESSPREALRARIDATLLRQALSNIIRNGVEANPGRRVSFANRVAADNGFVRIALSNDGQPVPAAIAGRIFDPYVSGKSGKDNMGLGLAIVKKIVLDHGGEIAYVEEAGRPLFTISLPQVT